MNLKRAFDGAIGQAALWSAFAFAYFTLAYAALRAAMRATARGRKKRRT